MDRKSQFRMLVATFDQEQERAWSPDDFFMWINSHYQLRGMSAGWDVVALFEMIRNEGLYMSESGRAAPALFEIVTVLKVRVYCFEYE